jgi:hypothetical protein
MATYTLRHNFLSHLQIPSNYNPEDDKLAYSTTNSPGASYWHELWYNRPSSFEAIDWSYDESIARQVRAQIERAAALKAAEARIMAEEAEEEHVRMERCRRWVDNVARSQPFTNGDLSEVTVRFVLPLPPMPSIRSQDGDEGVEVEAPWRNRGLWRAPTPLPLPLAEEDEEDDEDKDEDEDEESITSDGWRRHVRRLVKRGLCRPRSQEHFV